MIRPLIVAIALPVTALAQQPQGQPTPGREGPVGPAGAAIGGAGMAVDKHGDPAIDPTENVKALMKASLEALEKIRAADERNNNSNVSHLRETAELRSDHLKELAELRAKHADQLRLSDQTLRLSDLMAADKTRQVDVLAASNSATQLATAVSALQSASDRNAETLRNQVADAAAANAKAVSDAATATATATNNLFSRQDERIATLERSAATGAGRQSVADPQVEAMNIKLNTLLESRAVVTGKSEGGQAVWGYLVGAIGVAAALFGAMARRKTA